MVQRIVTGVLALVALALGALQYQQAARLERLERAVDALRARAEQVASAPRAAPPSPSSATATGAPRPVVIAEEPPRSPAMVAAPRVAVTRDEIAHVESAVLSLLEADRPELREKLRAVVQEQQRTLEQEQREERRERWAARREARLLEVGTEIGLSEQQRTAILQIMLATRDQIGDMMQSAATPEAINEVRAKTRAVRDEAETQVRQLMSPQQYATFSERFRDDDDERRGPRREP